MPEKLLNYNVIELLGEGAKSRIYKVRDPMTGHVYALKQVERKGAKDTRYIEQMEAEFEISRQFNSPYLRRALKLEKTRNVMQFFQVTEAFLVMEYVEGHALDVQLPGSLSEVVDTFIQAGKGLQYMHKLGYVHCDTKPNNILRDDNGQVKVIDFGQSCKIGTVKERIQGTPDYISPEQVNREPMEIVTDVFNLGATLYWALTRKTIPTLYTVNKKGENSFLLMDKVETPQQVNPQVPTPLSNLIMECVRTTPKRRPQNLDEVLQRLEIAKHILQKGETEAANRSPEAPTQA